MWGEKTPNSYKMYPQIVVFCLLWANMSWDRLQVIFTGNNLTPCLTQLWIPRRLCADNAKLERDMSENTLGDVTGFSCNKGYFSYQSVTHIFFSLKSGNKHQQQANILEALIQCRLNVDPIFTTLAKHYTSFESTSRVCCYNPPPPPTLSNPI